MNGIPLSILYPPIIHWLENGRFFPGREKIFSEVNIGQKPPPELRSHHGSVKRKSPGIESPRTFTNTVYHCQVLNIKCFFGEKLVRSEKIFQTVKQILWHDFGGLSRSESYDIPPTIIEHLRWKVRV